jgi:hypothetical protein
MTEGSILDYLINLFGRDVNFCVLVVVDRAYQTNPQLQVLASLDFVASSGRRI